MKYKNRKLEEKYKEEILFALPHYINQLLLLLNSGMVTHEAMITIAQNYENKLKEKNTFERDYYNVYQKSLKTGKSMIVLFNEYCQKSHIKELSRIGNIICDSDKTGVELWDKLTEENRILWNERKRIAIEKIKLSESKMSFPLGLLLLALIIITAAPAMMQMNIN